MTTQMHIFGFLLVPFIESRCRDYDAPVLEAFPEKIFSAADSHPALKKRREVLPKGRGNGKVMIGAGKGGRRWEHAQK